MSRFDPTTDIGKNYDPQECVGFDRFEARVTERLEEYLGVSPGKENDFGWLLFDILVAGYDLCAEASEATRAELLTAFNSGPHTN